MGIFSGSHGRQYEEDDVEENGRAGKSALRGKRLGWNKTDCRPEIMDFESILCLEFK
jgi:hypothetical protein